MAPRLPSRPRAPRTAVLAGWALVVTVLPALGCASNSFFDGGPLAGPSVAEAAKEAAAKNAAADPKNKAGDAADADLPPHMQKLEDGKPVPKPTFAMELHGGGKPRIRNVPLEGTIFLQDALEMAGLTRIAGRYDVEIMRRTGQDYMPAKLEVVFDPRTKEVEDLYNYQILPGDRIVCRPTSRSSMDDFVDRYFPMGRSMGL